jgi:hypothetical protein
MGHPRRRRLHAVPGEVLSQPSRSADWDCFVATLLERNNQKETMPFVQTEGY